MANLLSCKGARLLALLLSIGICSALRAQHITTFDVPNSAATSPAAINPAGQITGSYQDTSGYEHGFLREPDGTISTFDVPNVPGDVPGCTGDGWSVIFTEATGISPTGQIVGRYMMWNPRLLPYCTRLRGFLRDRDGTFTTFGGEVWPQWWPFDQSQVNEIGIATGNVMINAEGLIAGWYGTDSVGIPFFGFLRHRNGTVTIFGLPSDYPFTHATAINTEGQITGTYWEDNRYHGFLRRRGGTIIAFDVANSSQTIPIGIDSAGEIIGSYVDANFLSHGFLREQDGTFSTFNVLDSSYTYPTAVNQRGDTAGQYFDASYNYHGFVRVREGTITTFDVPNSAYTSPTAINSQGQVAGWYTDGSGTHGFIRNKQCHTLSSDRAIANDSNIYPNCM